MNLSSKPYKLYTLGQQLIDRRKISKSLLNIVHHYYDKNCVIYYSHSGGSIVIFKNVVNADECYTNVFKWGKPEISPLELDALLAMDKL